MPDQPTGSSGAEIGGSGGYYNVAYALLGQNLNQVFARLDYDVTDNIKAYGELAVVSELNWSATNNAELPTGGTGISFGYNNPFLSGLQSNYSTAIAALTMALIVPTLAFYPVVFEAAWDAKAELVETRYASQPLNQRETVKAQLRTSLDQIDRFPDLRQLLAVPTPEGSIDTSTNRAFQVWQTTALAELPMTSSVELYRANGSLVSRFAFNLPEDLTGPPRSEERGCDWELFEETAPFFAEPLPLR